MNRITYYYAHNDYFNLNKNKVEIDIANGCKIPILDRIPLNISDIFNTMNRPIVYRVRTYNDQRICTHDAYHMCKFAIMNLFKKIRGEEYHKCPIPIYNWEYDCVLEVKFILSEVLPDGNAW